MGSEASKEEELERTRLTTQDSITVEGFEILGVLGEGGMSRVFKARQTQISRIVAIKVLHRHLMSDPAMMKRFLQEARLSTVLDHPNIARVYSFGVAQDEQPYLVMELCEGETLKSLLDRRQLEWTDIQSIFEEICNGLAHAHSHGVIHRDLKPANVFIGQNEHGERTVKLIDFGIAKLLSSTPDAGQKLTRTGAVIGSPHFMSPEQCLGTAADARADIYSLGCMFYYAITGAPPYPGESALEIAQMHLNGKVPTLADEGGIKASPALEKLIATALQKEPEKRFQSVQQFQQALREIKPGAVSMRRKRTAQATRPVLPIKMIAALLVTVLVVAGVSLATTVDLQPHNAKFEHAEKVFDQGNYEEALPLLIEARELTLRDDEATRLINDLCDLAVILRDDKRNCEEFHLIGEYPDEVVADRATETMANHPSKMARLNAALTKGNISRSDWVSHVQRSLDLSGLTLAQKAYCFGRLEFDRAMRNQGAGEDEDAADQYRKSLNHLQRANSPAQVAYVGYEAASFFSFIDPGETSAAKQQLLAVMPHLGEEGDRLSARMLVKVGRDYFLGAGRSEEAAAAFDRAGAIYAKKCGGHDDMFEYYGARAILAENAGDLRPEYSWWTRALNELRQTRGHAPAFVSTIDTLALNLQRQKKPLEAVRMLQSVLPKLRLIREEELRVNLSINTLSMLVNILSESHRYNEIAGYAASLVGYEKQAIVIRGKLLKLTPSAYSAAAYHAVCAPVALDLLAHNHRGEAIAMLDDEMKMLKSSPSLQRTMVDCYMVMSQVQATPEKSIADMESAAALLQKIGKTPDEHRYLIDIKARLAVTDVNQGRLAQAVPLLEEVVEYYDQRKLKRGGFAYAAPFALGNAYAKLGRDTDALTIYRKYLLPLEPAERRKGGIISEANSHYDALLAKTGAKR